ncbi:MAG: tRNA (adenosine(37)-N6)-dimethylallyltransferase MiaA [Acidimicrobiia bacterium]
MVAVVGPTAAGKSAVALELAALVGGEIVSADSMQVYRGMDIGTAKPSAGDRRRVPHHLIDLVDPEDDLSVAAFQAEGREVMTRLAAADTAAVIVGGSGLHLRALVDPLEFPPTDADLRRRVERLEPAAAVASLLAADPAAAEHVDLANHRRVVRALEVWQLTGQTPSARACSDAARQVRGFRARVPFVGVAFDPGDVLPGRVAARCDRMLEEGLIDEVIRLRPRLGSTARQAVGYKEVLAHLERGSSVETIRRAIIDATTSLARRQRTFFRKDPRLRWLPWLADPRRRLDAVCAVVEEAAS